MARIHPAMRRAGISNRPVWVDLNEVERRELLELVGLAPAWPVDLVVTPGVVSAPTQPGVSPPSRPGRGAGRQNDPAVKIAVDQEAVRRAKEHLTGLGWDDLEELGKPYDIVCRRSSDPSIEKHVEVKGTTGGLAFVELTPNRGQTLQGVPLRG